MWPPLNLTTLGCFNQYPIFPHPRAGAYLRFPQRYDPLERWD